MADISLDRICKSFDGKPVLTDLSCRFPEHGISCVTGPSGEGKTTLLRLIANLEIPDSGMLTGTEGRKVGMVFQEDRLIGSMSAIDNVRLTASEEHSRNELESAFRALGLGESMHQPAGTLSGGMSRRVALLRALCSDSDLLLFDEPFKGLDEKTRTAVISYTRGALLDRTCILVTHDEEEARMLGATVHVRI
ncbi:MAG: ATP-binding cassette domain-containing protein [Clostridia bacterium]|nr:ATP-binding cassette domain-containing protein [Clostridia bacterium]